ncbi:MAG: hypothetical protein OEW08_11955, partial [Gammaproteobacteria bacterium]|nr:hypothetical protein [Gammaproteobacteria bacterium]
MLRILGKISVFGDYDAINKVASACPIPNHVLLKVGGARKVSNTDAWCYGSAWYEFHIDELDIEVQNFLRAHELLATNSPVSIPGIVHAIFTLCPVGQNEEEIFSCLLTLETLKILSNLAL